MKKLKPKTGRLLISEPSMSDTNFQMSVLIITQHNQDETIGFILNQQTSFKINDLIDNFPKFDAKIYIGGPVEKNSLHFIHTLGNKIKNSVQLTDNLYWSGSFEDLIFLIENGEVNSNQIRFFAGYSGWSSDQLEQELETDSWIVANSDSINLEGNDKKLWRNFLKTMNKEYAIWSNMIEDPSLN
jgi:putative transcriptional regulator